MIKEMDFNPEHLSYIYKKISFAIALYVTVGYKVWKYHEHVMI